MFYPQISRAIRFVAVSGLTGECLSNNPRHLQGFRGFSHHHLAAVDDVEAVVCLADGIAAEVVDGGMGRAGVDGGDAAGGGAGHVALGTEAAALVGGADGQDVGGGVDDCR